MPRPRRLPSVRRPPILERDLEKWCRGKARERGCRFYKFTSPGNRFVSDRILIAPGGVIVFVELKQEGKKLAPGQEKWHREMQEVMGCRCETIDNKPDFTRLLDDVAPV